MADSDINGLAQAQAGYVDPTDELIIQKSGETSVKKIQVDDLFGGWKDLRASVTAAATGTGAPSLATFGPSANIKQLSFGIGDSVYLAMHVDHDIKVGSTAYLHVHWSTNGTSTGLVKWEIDYITAARNDTTHAAFGADATISVEAAPQGSAWEHIVTEDATGFTVPTVDSLILLELKRVAPSSGSNADTVFGLFVDLHYETQMYATKNRAPDFYT